MISSTEVYLQSLTEEEAISAKLWDQNTALRARIATLEAALSPFARYEMLTSTGLPDDAVVITVSVRECDEKITQGDLRRARAALDGK